MPRLSLEQIISEPLQAFAVGDQAWRKARVASLQESLVLSYLFISNDLAVVRQISDYVVVMHAGRVVEQGSAGYIFQRAQHPYTQALLAAAPGQSNDLEALPQRLANA